MLNSFLHIFLKFDFFEFFNSIFILPNIFTAAFFLWGLLVVDSYDTMAWNAMFCIINSVQALIIVYSMVCLSRPLSFPTNIFHIVSIFNLSLFFVKLDVLFPKYIHLIFIKFILVLYGLFFIFTETNCICK